MNLLRPTFLVGTLLMAAPSAHAQSMTYSELKSHASGHYDYRVLTYIPYEGSQPREQMYVYFKPAHPNYRRLPRGGYLYNPRLKKVWGVHLPSDDPNQQYALLREPIDWKRLETVDAASFPVLGPLPSIPGDAPGEPLGPKLEPPLINFASFGQPPAVGAPNPGAPTPGVPQADCPCHKGRK